MEKHTVNLTVQYGLCCGCGICIATCPVNCISWEKQSGLYSPQICETQCLHCGQCAAVCPGLCHIFESRQSSLETITGNVLECYTAWAKDAKLRHDSASGGVVSTLARELLISGAYDGAFCVDSYDYREQLKTRLYTAKEIAREESFSKVPKSRYLPVSHENAISYMMAHRDKKLILIGSSCAIRGMIAFVDRRHLKREQYLFIGLFCDRVFNYNIRRYFEDVYAEGRTLAAIHFKNKDGGGWPGDMKFFPEEGMPFFVSCSERAKAKDYFMPERCLYCVDKLNVSADISLGDNYTGLNSSELGSNSVIVRTDVGAKAWRAAQDKLEVCQADIADIQTAQSLDWRLNNLYFGDLKTAGTSIDLNHGVPREKSSALYRQALSSNLKKLETGTVYATDPEAVKRQMIRDAQKPNPLLRIVRRTVGYIKRKIF